MKRQEIKIRIAKDENDFNEGKNIILEYVDWLGIDLSFQNFDKEINNLSKMYSEPNGGIILALKNKTVIGIVCIRKFKGENCELKRMFVKKDFRNSGIGRMMLENAIALAKKLNFKRIKLDTDKSMIAAIKLYLEYGFKEISPYRYNPIESAKFYELEL